MLDVLKQHRGDLEEVCRRFRVRTLEVFGSAADGTFDPDASDLDFLVDFLPMTPSAHSRAYFGLWSALRDLFGREVDLVEASAVTNPYFRKEIDKQREVLYEARDRQVYAVVRHETVWGVVENDLPQLVQDVESLLTQLGPP